MSIKMFLIHLSPIYVQTLHSLTKFRLEIFLLNNDHDCLSLEFLITSFNHSFANVVLILNLHFQWLLQILLILFIHNF